MTHDQMVEKTISILENVKNGNISEAKKLLIALTPIEVIKLYAIGKYYPNELETLENLAIYNWD